MPTNPRITAENLDSWSRTHDTRATLPELIRRLILGTLPLSSIEYLDFPSGSAIGRPGYDGQLRSTEGSPWVPVGQSVWELSVEGNTAKANTDYKKRTESPGNLDPSTTTYVQVFLRNWPRKDEWRQQRNQEAAWREVRAYDVTDLQQWLEVAHVARTWLWATLHGATPDFRDFEAYWTDLSRCTAPVLRPDLLVAGRIQQVQDLLAWLDRPPEPLWVLADSSEEARAFLVAAVLGLDEPRRTELLSRSLVVSDNPPSREVIQATESLFLIPDDDSPPPIDRRHHVAYPCRRGVNTRRMVLDLTPPPREEVETVLCKMGLSDFEAERHARESHGRPASIIRRLAPNPSQPPWAEGEHASDLVPLLLAGRWTDSNLRDRESVSNLAEVEYRGIQNLAMKWAKVDGPPIWKSEGTWRWSNPDEAWENLAVHITPLELDRFLETAISILGTPHPKFELPPDERWMAHAKNKRDPFSAELRTGLVETLGYLAAHRSIIHEGQRTVDRVIHRVLQAQSSWEIWATHSGHLPALAEASPDRFLGAVEEKVLGDEETLRELFLEHGPLAPSSAHTGLLWALELLLWSPDHFGRALLVLARLAAKDPGGRLGNRPIGSIHKAFCTWLPQTTATVDQRLAALDSVFVRTPDIAWDAALSSIPRERETLMPSPKPRWRRWAENAPNGVLYRDMQAFLEGIVKRLLSRVESSEDRWSGLASALQHLPPDMAWMILEALEEDLPALQKAGAPSLRGTLREMVSRHRRVPDAAWVLPPDLLDRIEAVYHKFEPADLVARHAWLFSHHPKLTDFVGRNFEARRAAEKDRRRSAMDEILRGGDIGTIEALVQAADWPAGVGEVVSQMAPDDMVSELLDRHVDTSDEKLAGFVSGLIFVSVRSRGMDWATELISQLGSSWSVETQIAFARDLPFQVATWDLVDTWSADATTRYWSTVPIGSAWVQDPSDRIRAIESLLDADRPWATIYVAHLCLHDEEMTSKEERELLVRALYGASESSPSNELLIPSVGGYEVSQLIELIEASGGEDKTLIGLEWRWLPAIRDYRGPRVLQEKLASEPGAFAEVVSWVYRADDSEGEDPDSPEEDEPAESPSDAMIQRAWDLLEHWSGYPGMEGSGQVDGDKLKGWVQSAREVLAGLNRTEVGDTLIGRILARMPDGSDGLWPHEAAREVLERHGTPEMKRGFANGIIALRGVFYRKNGGDDERELAKKYGAFGRALANSSPTTASVLRDAAESYEEDARREDARAEREASEHY